MNIIFIGKMFIDSNFWESNFKESNQLTSDISVPENVLISTDRVDISSENFLENFWKSQKPKSFI